jgi:GNAT superfamily N-acetyltransferase
MTVVSIEPLSGCAEEFAHLTFPRYRSFLRDPEPGRVVVGARIAAKPIGLALAAWRPDLAGARLFSLMVAPECRRQSIGRALLTACESLVAGTGRKRLDAFYSSLLPAARPFAALLVVCGWHLPQARELRCTLSAGMVVAAIAGWPGATGRLLANKSFTTACWAERTAQDVAKIEELSKPPSCPPGLSPQHWSGWFDEGTSLVLRMRGEAVGWILARLDPPTDVGGERLPTLAISAAFIRRDLWRSGMMVAAYHAIARIHANQFGAAARVRFSTTASYAGMMALTRRRLVPIALWTDEWMESSKSLV